MSASLSGKKENFFSAHEDWFFFPHLYDHKKCDVMWSVSVTR